MIRTYLLHVDEADKLNVDKSLFSQRRQENIERLKNESDKRLSAAAEILLIHALKQLCPEIELPLPISEDSKGLPVLDKKLEFSDELKKKGFKNGAVHFSISHSHDYAACSVSNEPVGVDIEWIKRAEIQHPEKLLFPEEAETLAFISNRLEKQKYFFECWTQKESYLKNLGIGLVVRSSDFMVAEDRLETASKKLKKRYVHCMEPGEVRGTDWKFDANYKVSVCSMKKDEDTETRLLTAEDIKL